MKTQSAQLEDEKENPTFWPGDDMHTEGEVIPGKEGIDPNIKEETRIPKVQ